LIRPASHFSIAASKLADYQIEIGPANSIHSEGITFIDQIEMNFKGKFWQEDQTEGPT
jgi:hypothetical protein